MFKFIAALFSKVAGWFTKTTKKGKAFLKKEIPVAIGVVEMVKRFVDSPATPLLTKLIPGNVDDALAENLKVWLPKVLLSLHLVQDTANLDTNNDIIQAVIARLSQIPAVDRKGKYLEIAAKLSEYMTDGKLSWAEIIVLIQGAFETNQETAK